MNGGKIDKSDGTDEAGPDRDIKHHVVEISVSKLHRSQKSGHPHLSSELNDLDGVGYVSNSLALHNFSVSVTELLHKVDGE